MPGKKKNNKKIHARHNTAPVTPARVRRSRELAESGEPSSPEEELDTKNSRITRTIFPRTPKQGSGKVPRSSTPTGVTPAPKKAREESEDFDIPNRIADNLARILEGGSICAAVCQIDDDIIISTNLLFEKSKDDSKGTASQGYKLIYNVVGYLQECSKKYVLDTDLETDRLEIFRNICDNRIKAEKGNLDLDDAIMSQITAKLLDDHRSWKDQTIQSIYDEFDVKVGTTIASRILSAHNILSRAAHDFKKVEREFLSEDSSKINFLILREGEKNIHAELRIIDHLFNEEIFKKLEGEVYLGISKLCCTDCKRTIKAVNQAFESDAEYEEVVIKYGESSSRDTHGMEFSGNWVEPIFLSDTTKEIFKDIQRKYKKLSEKEEKNSTVESGYHSQRGTPSDSSNPESIRDSSRRSSDSHRDKKDGRVLFGGGILEFGQEAAKNISNDVLLEEFRKRLGPATESEKIFFEAALGRMKMNFPLRKEEKDSLLYILEDMLEEEDGLGDYSKEGFKDKLNSELENLNINFRDLGLKNNNYENIIKSVIAITKERGPITRAEFQEIFKYQCKTSDRIITPIFTEQSDKRMGEELYNYPYCDSDINLLLQTTIARSKFKNFKYERKADGGEKLRDDSSIYYKGEQNGSTIVLGAVANHEVIDFTATFSGDLKRHIQSFVAKKGIDSYPITMLAPYKLRGWHWNALEINVEKDKPIEVISHDPKGGGEVEENMQKLLTSFLGDTFGTDVRIIYQENSKAKEPPRQMSGVNCGCVVVEDIINLMNDKSVNDVDLAIKDDMDSKDNNRNNGIDNNKLRDRQLQFLKDNGMSEIFIKRVESWNRHLMSRKQESKQRKADDKLTEAEIEEIYVQFAKLESLKENKSASKPSSSPARADISSKFTKDNQSVITQ